MRFRPPVALIFGLIVAAPILVLLVVGLLRALDPERLERVVVPGIHELSLDESGRYRIFYEYRSLVGGRRFDTGPLPQLEVSLSSVRTGTAVALHAVEAGGYSTPARAGVGMLSFDLTDPGVYRLSAVSARPAAGTELVLAIGPDLEGRIGPALVAIPLVALAILALAIFTLRGIVRRVTPP